MYYQSNKRYKGGEPAIEDGWKQIRWNFLYSKNNIKQSDSRLYTNYQYLFYLDLIKYYI